MALQRWSLPTNRLPLLLRYLCLYGLISWPGKKVTFCFNDRLDFDFSLIRTGINGLQNPTKKRKNLCYIRQFPFITAQILYSSQISPKNQSNSTSFHHEYVQIVQTTIDQVIDEERSDLRKDEENPLKLLKSLPKEIVKVE